MTTHHHAYRTFLFSTISLPDCDGYAEHFLAWDCVCGDVVWATGTFGPHACALSPAQWQAAMDAERRTQNALTLAAQQTEKQYVPITDKYETFTKRKPHAYPPARSH